MTEAVIKKGPQELVALFACDERGGIGLDGSMPWHFPSDLARFKSLTLGNPIIMGRLTFLSLPRSLPGRKNIILTSGREQFTGAETASSIDAALELVSGCQKASVIGGAAVFGAFAGLIDRYEITRIPGDYDCDVFVNVQALVQGLVITAEEHGEDGLVYTTYARSAA